MLTGCSVREPDRAGLRRRYPAVDLFLRPDEEPELVDRLGLASAQAPIGPPPSRRSRYAVGATTTVGRTVVGVADGLSATRARAVGEGTVARGPRRSAPGCRSSTAATRRAPTASCRSAAARSAAARSTTSSTRRARSPPPATARSRCSARTSTRTATTWHPEPRFAHVDAERWAGRQLDLHGRPDLAELIRAIDGLRTADGRPAIPRLRFVTSHPWDLSDRLIEALADCPSVCEHLHLPVQSGDDAVLRRMGRQYTIEHYEERLGRIRDAVPGITISTDIIVGFCGETEAQFALDAAAPRDGPLRPGLRRGVLPAAGDAGARSCADDVPADVKRRRLNELLALQEGIGLERNRGLARARRRGPGGHRDPAARPRPRGADRRCARDDGADDRDRGGAGSPAGPAATSSSTCPAAPSCSGARSRSASTTPARMRCVARPPEPSAPRERCPAADRRRGRDRDRQDRVRHRARGTLSRDRAARGDHLGRLPPGLSRPRHRHGQGDGRRPGTRPAPRPRPGRPRPAVQRRRLRRPRPVRAGSPGCATAGSPSSPAARGCTCGSSPAASTRPPCRAIPSSAPGSRPSSSTTACRRSSCASRTSRPSGRRPIDLANPRRVVRALEIAELDR